MYRLIIVDDEEEIRDGLTDLIDWPSLGFVVIDKLPDGREAIQYVQEHKVDVILTDIKMTFASGIDVAKLIWDKKLPIKIVFLSGFQEFSLAREAIRYNVSHYLLKPTDLDEVADVFRKIHTELEKEKEEREKTIRQQQHVKTLKPLLIEQLLNNLMFGGIASKEKKEIGTKLKQLGLPVDFHSGLCCTMSGVWSGPTQNFSLERNMEDRQALSLAITKERDQVHYVCVKVDGTRFLIVGHALAVLSSDELQRKAEQFFKHIQSSLSSLLGLVIRLESLELFSTLTELLNKYEIHAASAVPEEKRQEPDQDTAVQERMIIKRAKQYISEHLDGHVSLAEVADHVGLNPVYFSRLFKQETRISYSDYVIDVRIKKAIDYLGDPKYKVYEIGYLVGYKNTKHFHQLFKRQTGLTPSEYRDKL